MSMSNCGPIHKDDVLVGKSALYKVLDFNGEGVFATVAKCINVHTSKTVAVKIHKKPQDPTIQAEITMLEAVRQLDPEKANVVKFIDSFHFQGRSCLAFEMLDKSLWDLMKEQQWKPLSLNEIRPVAQQLLAAFHALKGIGIIHTDLKPDNVMLVNHRDQPFRVKLIDFGLARPVSFTEDAMTLQPIGFRAPEIILGLRISEAIDMWGLGCLLGFLYFGHRLIRGSNAYNNMACMCHLLGQPKNELLNVGLFTNKYFIPYCDENKNLYWRLKTPREYRRSTGDSTREIDVTWATDLEDAVMNVQETQDPTEFIDRANFLHLLQGLLLMDPDQRVQPGQGLEHPFITVMNLLENGDSQYAEDAFDQMEIITRKTFELAETDQKLQSDSWSDSNSVSAWESNNLNAVWEIPLVSWLDSHSYCFSAEVYPESNGQKNCPSCNSYTSGPKVPTELNEDKYGPAPEFMDMYEVQKTTKERFNITDAASLESSDQESHPSFRNSISSHTHVTPSTQIPDAMNVDQVSNSTEEPRDETDETSTSSSGNLTPGTRKEDNENNSTKPKKTKLNTLQHSLQRTGATLVRGFQRCRKILKCVFC